VLEHVRRLLDSVRALEELYPGRHFTLDGHLVGSIGEALAAELYGLTLLPSSSKCHDATCPEGREVQVKLTQRNSVALYEEPKYLLVLRLSEDGTVREVYNGPGSAAWSVAGRRQKNGQRAISVSKLRALAKAVAPQLRIEPVVSANWFVDENSAPLNA